MDSNNIRSRAQYSMGRDGLIPKAFAVIYPKYNTSYRAIMFLLPISLAFGFTGMLYQVITFSILSALLLYILTGYMAIKFRKMYPIGTIDRGYISPLPIPGCACDNVGVCYHNWDVLWLLDKFDFRYYVILVGINLVCIA